MRQIHRRNRITGNKEISAFVDNFSTADEFLTPYFAM